MSVCKNCGDTVVPCPVYEWTHDEAWNTGPDCQLYAEPASPVPHPTTITTQGDQP